MGEAHLFEHTHACMYTLCKKKKLTQNVILAFPYGEEVKKKIQPRRAEREENEKTANTLPLSNCI